MGSDKKLFTYKTQLYSKMTSNVSMGQSTQNNTNMKLPSLIGSNNESF